MKTWRCECGNRVYFENTVCHQCKNEVGFYPSLVRMVSGKVTQGVIEAAHDKSRYRHCAHRYDERVCNWLVSESNIFDECIACRLNETVKESEVQCMHVAKLELAKRRLLYSLFRLGLPVSPKNRDKSAGLSFRFLGATNIESDSDESVITGHHLGTITINSDEADDSVLERMRQRFGEPYRTLLGHFRHESGHYYWERLIVGSEIESQYKALFGDPAQDYQESLDKHYENGPPLKWEEHFMTAYAASHPWEDWAETWAHYLHMMDTLETAYDHGLLKLMPASHVLDYSFDQLLSDWMQLTVVINNLGRSLGAKDLYPFVVFPAVAEKLRFVHYVIRQNTTIVRQFKPEMCET